MFIGNCLLPVTEMEDKMKEITPKYKLGRAIRLELRKSGMFGKVSEKDELQDIGREIKLSKRDLEMFFAGSYTLSSYSPLETRVMRIADLISLDIRKRHTWRRLVEDVWMEHWANRF